MLQVKSFINQYFVLDRTDSIEQAVYKIIENERINVINDYCNDDSIRKVLLEYWIQPEWITNEKLEEVKYALERAKTTPLKMEYYRNLVDSIIMKGGEYSFLTESGFYSLFEKEVQNIIRKHFEKPLDTHSKLVADRIGRE